MATEYFIIMLAMLVVYPVLRYVVVSTFDDALRLSKIRRADSQLDGHSLDANPLANRVRQVREEISGKNSSNQFKEFKRSALVESKRQELARLRFFQPPPNAPAPEREDERHSFLLCV